MYKRIYILKSGMSLMCEICFKPLDGDNVCNGFYHKNYSWITSFTPSSPIAESPKYKSPKNKKYSTRYKMSLYEKFKLFGAKKIKIEPEPEPVKRVLNGMPRMPSDDNPKGYLLKNAKWKVVEYNSKTKIRENIIDEENFLRLEDIMRKYNLSRTTIFKYKKMGFQNPSNITIEKL